MKGILWSIQKPHTDNIKSGKKTIEVRKFIPKDITPETPNFIYETKANGGCGKVIGEFKCNKIEVLGYRHIDLFHINRYVSMNENPDCEWEKHCCLTSNELFGYAKGKTVYGLHITDLKIYDKPKELSDFMCCPKLSKCSVCEHIVLPLSCIKVGAKAVQRAPQSYMFVREAD